MQYYDDHTLMMTPYMLGKIGHIDILKNTQIINECYKNQLIFNANGHRSQM